jgi:hypothetical protein
VILFIRFIFNIESLCFLVNTRQAGQGQLKVELIQPQISIAPSRCQIQEINPHEYRIQYIPTEPGRYQLRILFNNQLVQGKTFDTDVYYSLPQAPTVRLQQILPNHTPVIGDDICLQSNEIRFPLMNQFHSLSVFVINSQY